MCFQALSKALKFLFQIQASSRISQAYYEPWLSLHCTTQNNDSLYKIVVDKMSLSLTVSILDSVSQKAVVHYCSYHFKPLIKTK